MQRLIVDVEDRYINLVVDLLSNLKQNVVKNVTIQNEDSEELEQNKNIVQSQLEEFHRLRNKSNNKIQATMKLVANTDEMVDDGIF